MNRTLRLSAALAAAITGATLFPIHSNAADDTWIVERQAVVTTDDAQADTGQTVTAAATDVAPLEQQAGTNPVVPPAKAVAGDACDED